MKQKTNHIIIKIMLIIKLKEKNFCLTLIFQNSILKFNNLDS